MLTNLKNTLSVISQILQDDVIATLETTPIVSPEQLSQILSNILLVDQHLTDITNFFSDPLLFKGDKGDQGIQGEQGIQGIQGEQGIQGLKGDKGDAGTVPFSTVIYKTYDSSISYTISASQAIPELSFSDFVANALYEFTCYINFTSASITTGISLGMQVPTNATFFGEIDIPISNTPNATPYHLYSPNPVSGFVTSTGVGAVGQVHTAIIKGHLKMGALGASLDFRPVYASEVSGSAVTVKASSFMIINRVA